MSKAVGSSLVLSLLVFGCGRLEQQPIGDTMGGEGGSGGASVQASGGSKTMSVSGSAGTAVSNGGKASGNPDGGEECGGQVCEEGSSCFVQNGATNEEGVCVPLCNPEEQTDQTTYNLPCSGAVGGGDGICRAFLRWVELVPVMGLSLTPVGICTKSCDPLEQDCPEGFSCDLTDTPEGPQASWSYACLPVLSPRENGAECDGSPIGYCQVGATCVLGTNGSCAEFCDTEASNACPAMQECSKPEWFPADSPAGVCVTP